MSVSVVDPIGRAIDQTKRILFAPFDLRKWLVLGFCAFLATFGDDTIPGGAGWQEGGGFDRFKTQAQSDVSWLADNALIAAAGAAGSVVVILVVSALVIWLRSRGRFMLLDGIVHNRGAVVEPWQNFRELANSLFGFAMFLVTITILAVALLLVVGVIVAWPDIRREDLTASSVIALCVSGLLAMVVVSAVTLVLFLLRHFVVPTMYLRNALVMVAWRIVREELIARHAGHVLLFFLMRIVLAVGIAFVAVLLAHLTCCVSVFPYLGTVVLLPLIVFSQCYTLCFLEQFGPDWSVFSPQRAE